MRGVGERRAALGDLLQTRCVIVNPGYFLRRAGSNTVCTKRSRGSAGAWTRQVGHAERHVLPDRRHGDVVSSRQSHYCLPHHPQRASLNAVRGARRCRSVGRLRGAFSRALRVASHLVPASGPVVGQFANGRREASALRLMRATIMLASMRALPPSRSRGRRSRSHATTGVISMPHQRVRATRLLARAGDSTRPMIARRARETPRPHLLVVSLDSRAACWRPSALPPAPPLPSFVPARPVP